MSQTLRLIVTHHKLEPFRDHLGKIEAIWSCYKPQKWFFAAEVKLGHPWERTPGMGNRYSYLNQISLLPIGDI